MRQQNTDAFRAFAGKIDSTGSYKPIAPVEQRRATVEYSIQLGQISSVAKHTKCVIRGAGTVVEDVGDGRKAARAIDRRLRNS